MVGVRNLSKRYGDKFAVDGLDFVVQPGVVTGFLGPNGAGKSTTMRLIAGLDEPTTGSVRVNGKDYRSAVAPMAELGLLLEAKAMHTGRSARDHLLALAQTNGISRRRVNEVIDMVGLREVAGKRVGGFSLGMGQRLGVAQALLGDPGVVVLDEPVNGLDPEGVLWIRNLLKALAADGRTVFVSSHLMGEMAQTATQLIVVGRGRLIADTTVEEFVARASGSSVTVRTPEAGRLRDLLLPPGRHHHQRAARRAARAGPERGADRRRGLAGARARLRAVPAAGLAGAGLHGNHPGLGGVPLRRRERDDGGGGMTTMTYAAPTAPATGQQMLRVTQPRVLLSEWTKFRSLRSTMWTLLTAVVLTIGIGALFSAVTANQYHTFSAADRASFNPVTTSLNGILFSQLAIGVLGVLLISGEYSTGMIRSSLTAVPRRLPVLRAKLGFRGVAFAVMLVTSFVSFFVGQALLSSHHLGVSISAPNALRDVTGAALYVTAAGIIGMTLGALMRNTAAGISTMAPCSSAPAGRRPAAVVVVVALRAVPALQRRRGPVRGRERPGSPADVLDRLRPPVRLRGRADRPRRLAAAARRRLIRGDN